MKVTVLGAGPIGLTYAALLLNRGHEVVVHAASSPAHDRKLEVEGAVSFSGQIRYVTDLGQAIAEAEVLLCARRATGVKALVDELVDVIAPGQTLIFSAELALGSLYAALQFNQRGHRNTIISWSTTVATAQRYGEDLVVSGTLRDRVDYAVTNPQQTDSSGALLEDLFGPRFHKLQNALAVALSNLNPPIHLANSLANLTRMEKGEDWDNYANITPAVGRVIEALDLERLALARRLNLHVRNVHEHYLMTFPGLTPGSVADMAAQVCARGPRTRGPTTLDTRYITEDIPYGLIPILSLAKRAGVKMPLHQAGISLAATYTGRDFYSENTMLLDIEHHWDTAPPADQDGSSRSQGVGG